jgi:sporulation protein YlmC with PRC-barrel domain
MKEQPRFLSATTIISDKVINPAGQTLGEIRDLMIDLEAGRIAYAVLAVNEMEGKLFAIPWSMFSVDSECRCVILKISRSLLDETPGMDEEAWAQYAPNHDWLARIYEHYGSELYW